LRKRLIDIIRMKVGRVKMCGIIGGSKLSWNYEAAVASIKHRGPDAQRICKFMDFALAFVRLSIIDLSDNGMQPMQSEDRNVAIVFNGEIYGFQKLRNQLIYKGYKFSSSSDTEVILNAYLEYGDKFVHHIDGMFAIVIYDKISCKIKLYRDRVGIKPLYYFYNGKDFAFASELKAITNLCNDIDFNVDYTAIYDYLTYSYIPEPKTMYKNVFKLPPGHYLIYDLKSNRIETIRRYWKLNVNDAFSDKSNIQEVNEEIRRLIGESVNEQLVSDVPVGSFLSGGIDSSVVTYEIMKINPKIEAFSLGFSYKKYDELQYADLLVNDLNIIKNQEIVDKNKVSKLYPKLKEWYDEPYSDTSAYPTYLVSKLARKKVSVVLTGDGGDEVFGGYSRYNDFQIYSKDSHGINNAKVSLLFERLVASMELPENSRLSDFFLDDIVKICIMTNGMPKMFKKEYAKQYHIDKDYDDYWFFRKHYHKEFPPITRMQYLDFHTYLPGDILTKIDRVSMQHSLEARVPFLSKKIVEFAFGIAQETRCPSGKLKGILKDSYRDLIPDKILDRRKMGFNLPNTFIKGDFAHQEELLKSIWKL
jgi:asparagine synthase (glutamine-hydrolysing)